MEHVRVATTDIEVSRVGLGTWAIGGWLWGGTDEQQAIRTIHEALDRGITLIDTAPVYGFGISETIVGKAVASSRHRDRAVIATKLGLAWEGENVHRDTSRRQVFAEVEASLERLGRDHVDIYQVHWPDPLVPAEETAGALADLLEQGKIRAIGVSNYSPAQMEAFAKAAPLHTAQPPYNLFEREVEQDVLPYCHDHGVTTLLYGALCRGMLSGRMRQDTRFEGDDIRKSDPKFMPRRRKQYLSAVAELEKLASELDKSLVQLAVRWVLDQPGADVALWGARHPDQLEPLHGVSGWRLTVEQLARIDGIVAKHVVDPVGPEFMAPPARKADA